VYSKENLFADERFRFSAMIRLHVNSRGFIGRLASAILLAILCFLIGAPPGTTARAQSATHKTSKTKAATKPVVNDAAVPFRAGETLQYQVGWATFSSAASVQLAVPEKRDLSGWGTWHFRATAHTANTVRSLYPIDDQFDSYTDTVTLESRQYEMYLNENGKKQEQSFHLQTQGQAPHGEGPRVVVLPGTRDPLGALYSLRGVDWQKTPEFRVPVYDGRDLYEIRARLEAADETVSVAAGKFSASHVSIRLFRLEKEVSAMNFSAWFAHDAARTPVLMEAELPFGSLRVELTSATQ